MATEIDDPAMLGQAGLDSALNMWGEWTKGWQAVTAEMADYSKRSIEESTRTIEQLMTARSIEQVMEIQTGYAKRAYDDYVMQMSRLGSMYADMTKDGAKPLERLAQYRH